MTDKAFLSWQNFEAGVYMLARTIEDHGDPDVVVGISRGGLPGSVMLSHALEVPHVAISADLYDGEEQGDEVEIGAFTEIPEGDVVLFDDVVDSGKTMKAVYEKLDGLLGAGDGLVTASIHVKEGRDIDPEYWVEETDSWVVYPWEITIEDQLE